jgi:hypothetical protein
MTATMTPLLPVVVFQAVSMPACSSGHWYVR